jgi:hypothetical protein
MQLVLPATSAFGKEDNGKFPFRPYIQHLASHNVSAGRVITKMAFDTKAPTPKVLFSPVGAVDESDLETIARQAKSPAAEAAIKLNVFQTDETSAPAQAPTVNETVEEDEEAPPVKRESKASGEKASDVSDIVKKWSKK